MDCLNHEMIECYVKKMLSQDEQAVIDHHINDCRVCRDRISNAMENELLLSDIHTHQFPLISHTAEESPGYRPSITTAQAQEMLGQQYTIVKKIGQGGSGDVFQAIDPALERPVAIKFFREATPFQKWDKDQWQEGKFMSQMNHPHVAHIYHIGESDGKHYVVMEYIKGLSLTEAWEKQPLPKRLTLFLQVLEAIGAAHKKGIVHRDVKPSNVLVSASGDVKVLDFGIAMAVNYGDRTERNVYRGTPAYSAPEQITCPGRISPATDVFALGVLLYQLLTNNNLPFPQTDSKELFEAICNQNPELPSAIQQSVPLPLQNICLKALEKDVNNRYRDANALSSDVSRFLRGEKVWSRPSFVSDQVQQEIFYHRQRLEVWHHNGLITETEHDKLENIYDRVVAPADLSIVEARKLSFSQVCLYLGGWITILGCAVLLSSEWCHISRFFRPIPAMLSVVLMILCGRHLWTKKETRL
ncbi:MAG: serine/threonine protein kinase, partial [Planctomycetota bacterium]